MRSRAFPLPLRRQSGASLLIALIMLIVVMLLGTTASRMALMNEKASRNDRDRQIAFQAAEAALRDAELLLQSTAAQERSKLFPVQPGRCLDGLCRASGAPLWTGTDGPTPASWAQYGRFSGRSFSYGAASLAMQPPHYLIELFDDAGPHADTPQRYRITAVGFGSKPGTQVLLQTLHAARGESRSLDRLSWREINE